MGQTLTHGIYLPDEGERNCYAGLAANWQILDNSVGTIAEHTTALSGKAPLVHTHTKSDITDFPAYGNAAGTICEGNDSRLSDARTPVAHTHTKADITDLFDSANTWSADNIYTYSIAIRQTNLEEGELPASNQSKRFRFIDKNDASLGWLLHRVGTSGDSYLECVVVNKFSNGQLSTQGSEIRNSITIGLSGDGSRYLKVLGDVYPDLPTRVCNLGTSTNQWNNLYAKNYYYNGTEFQSKFVTTDTAQTVNGIKTFTAYVGSIGSSTGDEYSSNTRTNLWLMGNRDTQEVSGVLFDTYRQNTAQGTGIHILGISIKENSVRYEGCRWGWYWDNNLNGYTFDFKPTTQGANQALKHNLGTSNDKWDTLNGINPGALSLPDISSAISIDTTNWDLTNYSANFYTPSADGWIFFGGTTDGIQIDGAINYGITVTKGYDGFCEAFLPVLKDKRLQCRFKNCTLLKSAKFYPCLGNV